MSFKPKYEKVEVKIKELTQELNKKGEHLPSERELAKRYGVSRTTIKIALENLEEQGIVKHILNKGYLIIDNQPVKVNTSMHIGGFYDEAVKRKKKVTSKVLDREVIWADEEMAKTLSIEKAEPVFHLLRLRSIDGKVYSLTESYLPLGRCSNILNVDLKNKSLWKELSSYGLNPYIINQKVSARPATPFEVEKLHIPAPKIVMVVRNMAFADGKPIELSFVRTNVFSTELEYTFKAD